MAEAEEPQDAAPKKRSKLPIILGVLGALILGGGGFFATYSGLILGEKTEEHAAEPTTEALPDIAFVPVDPVVISLGQAGANQQLRLVAQLEVSKAHAPEVSMLMPRILDVVNSYLRAVEVTQLQDPAALVRLRAQMLRRIQIVTGDGRVRDLLITEFMLN
ncbi:flagellar basal body-associated FliL family protein [Gemmobacter denitrificans]|uniref:Flagellar protein FliL n=1 Tax=Gemmobacter denitrificans TaxID=3123040 RepID=A0ABU8BZY3_9RHOB